MTLSNHVRQMAKYNEWMNTKLFVSASLLPHDELVADKGAFFGSILGTLNHIAVGDTIWLKRFGDHFLDQQATGRSLSDALKTVCAAIQNLPTATSLKQHLHPDLPSLNAYRRALDVIIIDWAAAITEADLDCALRYHTTQGEPMAKSFFNVTMHFFNHQTHHRGQVTTLLSQAGLDAGVTDLLVLTPNEDAV